MASAAAGRGFLTPWDDLGILNFAVGIGTLNRGLFGSKGDLCEFSHRTLELRDIGHWPRR
jgi:hypothetical protein